MTSNGKLKRRTFAEEFKRDAAHLVMVEGYTILGAAWAVNMNENSLRYWYNKYAPETLYVFGIRTGAPFIEPGVTSKFVDRLPPDLKRVIGEND